MDPKRTGGPTAAPEIGKAERKRRWIRGWHVATIAGLLGAAALAAGGFYWLGKGPIRASGGRYFFQRVVLPVPHFAQGDERWRGQRLGPTRNSIGAEGCALVSAAMVMASYGVDTDPARMNDYLVKHEGYTPQGWIYWEKAAELANGRVEKAYEDAPSYALIDSNLARGNPVIVRLRYPHGVTHFVVIVGKDGWDYLTLDPGRGFAKGVYPLKEFGSKIEALRFYRPVPAGGAGGTAL